MRKLLLLLLGMMLLYAQLSAQTRTLTGKVTDTDGNPIPNATVLVKGTRTGTTTNSDGVFSLTVSNNAKTLVISSIGMESKEIAIGSQPAIVVALSSTDKTLEEVVVTGVGTATSKKKVAFAVQSISSDNLPKVPQASIDQALVGKVAGAQIMSTSGQPGQQANIILRGINSLGSTQPMILVDGIQVNAGSNANGSGTNASSRLSDLDLSNVEKVEVIQGSAAATIYGAQGANGVIQIFTKKGKRDGRIRINFDSRVSFDNVLRGNLDLAKNHFYETDAEGYLISNSNVRLAPNSKTKVWALPKQPPVLANAVNDKPFKEQTFDNVDNVFINNATTFNNSLTISGGREKFDFLATVSRLDQESIVFGNYNRNNLSLNLGAELFKNFTVRSITQLAYSANTTGGITGQNNINSPMGAALNTRQYMDLRQKDSLGNYVVNPTAGETSINPFYSQQFRNYDAKTTRIVQNTNLNYKPWPFLELDYKYGIDNYVYDLRTFIAYQLNTLTPAQGLGPTNGNVSYANTTQTLKNSIFTAFVKLDFEKDLKINIPIASTTQLAYDYRKNRLRTLNASGTGFAPYPPYNINNASSRTSSENTTEFSSYGYLVNQRFDYGNLFGVSGGFRTDYSSNFGRGSSPFTFPRGDAYFRLSELLKINSITELKLRGAYGEAGIQPGTYSRNTTLETGNYAGNGYLALQSGSYNPDLTVEVSKELEAGVDLGLQLGRESFRNIRISATFWDRKSENVIRALDLPPSQGALTYLTNAIWLNSRGFEFSLDADILNKKDFTWDFGIRFGTSKSEVDRISNGKEIALGGGGSGQFVLKEKVSVGAFFGIQPLTSIDQTSSKGIRYISEANAANYEVVNGMVVNKTTKAVQFTTEKVQMGDPNPKFNMSFFNNFTLFKNLTVSMQLDWVYGNKIYNQTRQWLYRDFISEDFDKPVTINGETKPWVNYYASLYNTNTTNSYFVEDGSFLRMRNLSMSYQLKDMIKWRFLSSAIFSVSARNLFTITNYSGMDPESSAAFNDPLRRGLDLYNFPNFRTYQVGLSLGF